MVRIDVTCDGGNGGDGSEGESEGESEEIVGRGVAKGIEGKDQSSVIVE